MDCSEHLHNRKPQRHRKDLTYVRQKINTNLEESSSPLDSISVDDVFSSICSGKKRESESYLNRFNIEYTIPEP